MSPLTKEHVIKIILNAVEKNFPKDCTCCGHHFPTYKEYLQDTHPLGSPISYDAENEDWQPQKPLGILAYWKCKFCCNTLTTNINDLEIETIWQLLSWIKEESIRRGVSSKSILHEIRSKMRKQVLGE